MNKLIVMQESEFIELVENVFIRLMGTPQPTEEKKEEKLFTAEEACTFLRCSKPTLHRWKKEGLVPHVRIGTNIRYKESDLNKLTKK